MEKYLVVGLVLLLAAQAAFAAGPLSYVNATLNNTFLTIDNPLPPYTAPSLMVKSGTAPQSVVVVRTDGSVGIGTANPRSTLNVIGTGNFTGSLYAGGVQVCTAANGLCVAGGGSSGSGWANTTTQTTTLLNVGVGTTTPGAKLHVYSANPGFTAILQQNGNATLQLFPSSGAQGRKSYVDFAGTFENYPTDNGPRGVARIMGGFNGGVWGTEFLSIGVGGMSDAYQPPTEIMRLTAAGNVGIGTNAPNAKLTVGTPLAGSALSQTLVTNAGALGTAAGSELALGSFGFTSVNNEELGVRAYRTANGNDWSTTAVGIGMDVDNSVRVNAASLWLNANGRIGVGTAVPGDKLEVSGGNIKVFSGGDAYNGGIYAGDPNWGFFVTHPNPALDDYTTRMMYYSVVGSGRKIGFYDARTSSYPVYAQAGDVVVTLG